MALVGQRSLQVILQRIVIPTPIISKIYAYPRRDVNKKLHLAVHIISDCGEKDTIIKKLCDRARVEFAAAYEHEACNGLELFKFVHSDTSAKVPERSQLLFVRPGI